MYIQFNKRQTAGGGPSAVYTYGADGVCAQRAAEAGEDLRNGVNRNQF